MTQIERSMRVFGPGKRRDPAVQIVEVRPTPAQAVCSECGQAYPVYPPLSEAEWRCPRCGPSVRLDTTSWGHRPHHTTRRRIFGQPLPLFAVLLVVSLLPLLTFLLLQLSQLRRPNADQSLAVPNRPAPTAPARPPSTDAQPTAAELNPRSIAQAGRMDSPAIGSDASQAGSEPNAGPLPLSRLLQDPGAPPQEELRLGCRFVRTIDPNPSWRLGLPEGEVQRPIYRMEVVDAAGHAVSQSFVAPGSQAERVVPWLMEGDWLEVVGTVVIRLDRPTRPPILGFLIREIRPADQPEASPPAA